jgi:hypothetical protein
MSVEPEAFKSERVTFTNMDATAEGTIPGVATAINLEVKKLKKCSRAAICIPTMPTGTVTYQRNGFDRKLRAWWETWGGNVARSLPAISNASQLFLVFEKTETEQYANCYYIGKEAGTSLKMTGKVANFAKLSLEAGISCESAGSWAFKSNVHVPGQKLTIFMQTAKLSLISFKHIKAKAIRRW